MQHAAGQLTSITSDSVPTLQLDEIHFDETMTALMKLPEEQREVLVLIGVEAFSYKDAAEMLGISVGTMTSRLGRAHEALRAASGREQETVTDAVEGNRSFLRVVK